MGCKHVLTGCKNITHLNRCTSSLVFKVFGSRCFCCTSKNPFLSIVQYILYLFYSSLYNYCCTFLNVIISLLQLSTLRNQLINLNHRIVKLNTDFSVSWLAWYGFTFYNSIQSNSVPYLQGISTLNFGHNIQNCYRPLKV